MLPSSKIKKICRQFLMVVVVLFVATLAVNLYIIFSTKNRIFYRTSDLPHREVALLLGTEPFRPDGSTNLHFINRTKAAAELILSGKATHLLISGNENNRGFNETLKMKNKILSEKVPEAALQLDFEGNRTFESIRRAKQIYHLQKIIIVTNSIHAPRAIFLCRHFGIDAVAFCPAGDPFSLWYVRYNIREYFARLIAVFDVMS
jgi:SanA protein